MRYHRTSVKSFIIQAIYMCGTVAKLKKLKKGPLVWCLVLGDNLRTAAVVSRGSGSFWPIAQQRLSQNNPQSENPCSDCT